MRYRSLSACTRLRVCVHTSLPFVTFPPPPSLNTLPAILGSLRDRACGQNGGEALGCSALAWPPGREGSPWPPHPPGPRVRMSFDPISAGWDALISGPVCEQELTQVSFPSPTQHLLPRSQLR